MDKEIKKNHTCWPVSQPISFNISDTVFDCMTALIVSRGVLKIGVDINDDQDSNGSPCICCKNSITISMSFRPDCESCDEC